MELETPTKTVTVEPGLELNWYEVERPAEIHEGVLLYAINPVTGYCIAVCSESRVGAFHSEESEPYIIIHEKQHDRCSWNRNYVPRFSDVDSAVDFAREQMANNVGLPWQEFYED